MQLSWPPGALVKGTLVTIHGLKSRSDLNGCDGVLATALEDGRHGVRVSEGSAKGTSVRIKPENLTPRQGAQGLRMSDNVVETLQRASVPQMAWVLTEFGASSSQFAELALLYACVLFSPEQVGFPAMWSRDGGQNVGDFLRAAGHLGVLRTLDAHLHNATVQERGIQQMMTLVSAEQAELRSTEAVNAAGGAAACVRAMRLHPSHQGVQTFGCRLLMNLSDDVDEASSSAAKRAVLSAGGIEAALQAVTAFPQQDDLLAPALKGCGHVVMAFQEAADAAVAAGAPRLAVALLDSLQVGIHAFVHTCMRACLPGYTCTQVGGGHQVGDKTHRVGNKTLSHACVYMHVCMHACVHMHTGGRRDARPCVHATRQPLLRLEQRPRLAHCERARSRRRRCHTRHLWGDEITWTCRPGHRCRLRGPPQLGRPWARSDVP